MAETIDSIHKKVCDKLKILEELETLCNIKLQSKEILDEYLYSISYILNENTKSEEYFEEYVNIYNSINIEDKIQEILFHIQKIKTDDNNLKEKEKLISNISKIDISFNLESSEKEFCSDCGGILNINTNILKLVCSKCGLCYKILGSLFDYQTIPTSKLKNNNCNYNKHSINWLMQIQAKKAVNLDISVWNKIENIMLKNKTRSIRTFKGNIMHVVRNLQNVKCIEFRPWLKELGLTKLNPDIPYLRKVLCKVIPYQLSHLEEQQILYLHSLSIEAYKELYTNEYKKNKKVNNPYVPYMIGKIMEYLFRENSKENIFKKSLLECIHVQGEETTQNKDNKWKKICEKINIEYTPTILSNYLKNY